MDDTSCSGYHYTDGSPDHTHAYLVPAVKGILDQLTLANEDKRLFELGCGNGYVAAALTQLGWQVKGVDPSEEGIRLANANHPTLVLRVGSGYDDLAAEFGTFPVVLCLEVIEHVYFPRKFAATLYSLVEPGGLAVVSTPYHGYLKNVALAITGKMDGHFTALWDHGHVKFWSFRTLRILLEETGFHRIEFLRVGRIPVLAKSMIAIAHR
jgi:2-polyprenyl-3-methyl-5-hydroxy-6-metoxy-1,4-benzoquinol methylase